MGSRVTAPERDICFQFCPFNHIYRGFFMLWFDTNLHTAFKFLRPCTEPMTLPYQLKGKVTLEGQRLNCVCIISQRWLEGFHQEPCLRTTWLYFIERVCKSIYKSFLYVFESKYHSTKTRQVNKYTDLKNLITVKTSPYWTK